MSNVRLVALALSLSAALAGCGPGTLVPSVTEPPNSAGSRADFDAKVSLGVELAALRGQNLVSVELLQRHQPDEALLALARARKSVETIQSLGGANAQPEFAQLGRAIDDAIGRLRQADRSGAVTKALAMAGRAALGIESKFVGDTSERPAYRASVVSQLVFGAATGYVFAVARDPIDPEAYRIAYGALREADNIHEGLATVVEEQSNDHARAADILFAAMFEAMPASNPPSDLRPLAVSAAAYLMGVLLTDDRGALAPPALDSALLPVPPQARLAFVAPLLEEALGAFESGEAGVADVLVEKTRASLCCPSTSAGDALEAELARLSSAIRSGAADSDISLLVEESSELAADAAAGE